VAFICSVLFLLILKYVIDCGVATSPQTLQQISYAALPFAGGFVTLSFCSLLRTPMNVENSSVHHLLRRVSEDPGRNFFVGFVMVAYLSLIRPAVVAYALFLPYVEFIAAASAVYVLYTLSGFSSKDFHVTPKAPSWERHVQKIRRETGPDLMRTTSVMEQFVANGVKEPLLVYLTLHLQRLGETEEAILKTLNPLIDYRNNAQRHRLYYLAFPWTKEKLATKNKKARENLLNALLESIDRA